MALSPEQIWAVYSLTNKTNFTDFDCGFLCNRACCRETEPGLGIYLLPGEEAVLKNVPWLQFEYQAVEDYDFPPSWTGTAVFARCSGNCQRDLRPIQCRTFPASPHITGNKLWLIKEPSNLPYRCPLPDQSLNKVYLQQLHRSWEILIEDKLIKDLVVWDSQQRLDKQLPIKVLYK